MARPVIGICTALERARWSVWDQQAVLLPRSFVDAIQNAGGLALMIPPDPQLVERPGEVLDMLDGLMLAGGADIDEIEQPRMQGDEVDAEGLAGQRRRRGDLGIEKLGGHRPRGDHPEATGIGDRSDEVAAP